MTKYQGCKCPVCQQNFTEQDTIVVCPDCGTPYHPECWKKHGECVFADRHGSGFEYRHPDDGPQSLDESTSVATEQTCPACHAKNPQKNIFCESCGAPLHGMYSTAPSSKNTMGSFDSIDSQQAEMFAMAGISAEQEFDGIAVKDWTLYLGRSSPYYSMIFQRMDQSRRKVFPSLAGLFFGPLFLLYRKVWGWGFLTVILSALCSVPTLLMAILASNNPTAQPADFLIVASQIASIVSIALQFFLMLYSFYLIRNDGAKKIKKFRQQASTMEEYKKLLKQKAAPGWGGIVLTFVIVFVISFLIAPLFGPHLSDLLFGSLAIF